MNMAILALPFRPQHAPRMYGFRRSGSPEGLSFAMIARFPLFLTNTERRTLGRVLAERTWVTPIADLIGHALSFPHPTDCVEKLAVAVRNTRNLDGPFHGVLLRH